MSEQTPIPQIVPGQRIGYHPVAQMFPLIEGEQFLLFCEDVRTHGQREPILWVPGEPSGGHDIRLIVDGRNRYRACEALAIEPQMVQWDGTGSLAELAASLNFFRRHLTPSQRAAAGVAIKRQYSAEAKATSLANLKRGDVTPDMEKIPSRENGGAARDRAAKVCDVNPRYIDAAEQVAEQAPETFAALVAGKVTISEAKRAYTGRPSASRPFARRPPPRRCRSTSATSGTATASST